MKRKVGGCCLIWFIVAYVTALHTSNTTLPENSHPKRSADGNTDADHSEGYFDLCPHHGRARVGLETRDKDEAEDTSNRRP